MKEALAQLLHLFDQQQAVVFCGAGISIEPPAGLPDWSKLRDYTLQAIAGKIRHCHNISPCLPGWILSALRGKKDCRRKWSLRKSWLTVAVTSKASVLWKAERLTPITAIWPNWRNAGF